MSNKSPNFSQFLDNINDKILKPAEDELKQKENPIEEFKVPYVKGEVSFYN